MTLTREQIEKRKAFFEKAGDSPELSLEVALCDLALVGLAVQPKPIEEAPKDGTLMLVFRHPEEGHERKRIGIDYWSAKYETWANSRPAMPPTHYIPLTSLPEPKI